jgi:hypothetical protein
VVVFVDLINLVSPSFSHLSCPLVKLDAAVPHSGLRRGNMAKPKGLSVTLSVGAPLRPYGIAYRRTYGLFLRRLFKNPFEVRCVVC